MAECIERANLIARIKYYVTHTPEGKGEHYAYSVMLNEVLNCPAADVAPVVHGRWERRRNVWYCTNCGKGYKITYGAVAANMHNYCPHCGAVMDGGAE